jgi:hypothetical protein
MILAIVGAVFIISKLKESVTNLETSSEAFKISLISASPGIIFGILGTSLMLATIFKQNDIDIKDVATYLNHNMYAPKTIMLEESPTSTGIDTLMKVSSPYNK